MLTIVDPETGNILAQHRNNPNIAELENFPGFPEGIQGLKLMHRMRQQALR